MNKAIFDIMKRQENSEIIQKIQKISHIEKYNNYNKMCKKTQTIYLNTMHTEKQRGFTKNTEKEPIFVNSESAERYGD